MKINLPRWALLTCLLSLSLIFLAGTASAQEPKKYEDAQRILEQLAEEIEDFVLKMDGAETANATAEALDAFAESMKPMVPKINAIGEKYPEIKDEDTHPELLKPLLQRIEKDFGALMRAYAKVMEYKEVPVVKSADEKYKAVMKNLK
ncbi:hypothetical protein ACFLR7_02930 [Acidobacteriota bacterium]